jgi:chemotaxis protein MotB
MYQNQGKGYSNYNLSADRANAVRQVLVQSGLEEQKVLRVVGMGSAAPFDHSDPKSPLNRRVTIVVLTQEAAKRILANQALEQVATDAEEAKRQIDAGPGASSGAASTPAARQPAQAAASR